MIARSSCGRFSSIRFIKSRNLVRVRAVVAICWRKLAMCDYSLRRPCGAGTPARCLLPTPSRSGCPIVSLSLRISLLDEMRRDQTYEFTGRYDFGCLPESWEMLLIARDQVVRPGSVGTLQKYVVIRVACDFKTARGNHQVTAVPDQLQQLGPKTLANP